LKIEGFQLDKLLTECLARGIDLRKIKVRGDLEMTLIVTEEDYNHLLKIIRSRYRVTVLKERGSRPAIKKLLSQKATLVGALLFAFLLYYQSLFVAEIRVYGYEAIPETQIRNVLKEAGFYEGCKKDIDISKVKQAVYDKIDNIVWIGISCKGNMAEVNVVEGKVKPPVLEEKTPCDIVADQAGYIYEIIPKEGLRTVPDGTFVNMGDILISGIVPLSPTAYGTSAASATERYVHASGSVKAKIPYRAIFYQERYERIQQKTGRLLYGMQITIGSKSFDTLNDYNSYEVSKRTSKNIFHTVKPFPIKFTFSKDEEVKLLRRERVETEIRSQAEVQLREYLRGNIPKNVQILNKSLNFSLEENIIEVSVMLETLQEIGKEQEIVFGEFRGQTERGIGQVGN